MFYISQLSVDVKFKQSDSYIDDIKYASINVSVWKGNYKTRMKKPPDSQTQHTLCNSIYTFYYSWISLPYKMYTFTKWSCWNRRVFKAHWVVCGDTSFCRSRWNCRYKSNEILAISCEVVPLNFSKQAIQKKYSRCSL